MDEYITLRVASITGKADLGACRNIGQAYGIQLVTDMSRQALTMARIMCPVRTGNLRAHHRSEITSLGDKIRGVVINDCEYALAVHNGSRARTITARGGGLLRFTVGGRTVYTRSVRHPRTAGKPWLATSVRLVATTGGWRFTA